MADAGGGADDPQDRLVLGGLERVHTGGGPVGDRGVGEHVEHEGAAPDARSGRNHGHRPGAEATGQRGVQVAESGGQHLQHGGGGSGGACGAAVEAVQQQVAVVDDQRRRPSGDRSRWTEPGVPGPLLELVQDRLVEYDGGGLLGRGDGGGANLVHHLGVVVVGVQDDGGLEVGGEAADGEVGRPHPRAAVPVLVLQVVGLGVLECGLGRRARSAAQRAVAVSPAYYAYRAACSPPGAPSTRRSWSRSPAADAAPAEGEGTAAVAGRSVRARRPARCRAGQCLPSLKGLPSLTARPGDPRMPARRPQTGCRERGRGRPARWSPGRSGSARWCSGRSSPEYPDHPGRLEVGWCRPGRPRSDRVRGRGRSRCGGCRRRSCSGPIGPGASARGPVGRVAGWGAAPPPGPRPPRRWHARPPAGRRVRSCRWNR